MTRLELPDGYAEWLRTGESGLSSERIAARMLGGPTSEWRHTNRHPHDPPDLRRCRLLLEAVPEWNDRIAEMADVSPEWNALVARWDDICTVMDEETPDWRAGRGTARRTYRLMRDILDAAQ